MGTITFTNHNIKLRIRDKLLLKPFLSGIFEDFNKEFKSISYIFCSDDYLLALNKQYLNHDTYTDILTFSLSETPWPIISEIYISVERVNENAQALSIAPDTELLRVMIHGILHLCGYSDHTSNLKKEMRAKEDFYLAAYCST